MTEDTYYKLLEATNKIQNALDDLNGGALNKRVKLDKKRKDMKTTEKEPERKAVIEKEQESEQKEVAETKTSFRTTSRRGRRN